MKAPAAPLSELSIAPVEITPIAFRRAFPLRAALPGLAFAVFAVLFGFAMGGLFGLNEAVPRILDELGKSVADGAAPTTGS